MTRKQLDTSREARLWIIQIAVPAISLAASVMSIPEVREAVAAKARSIKYSIDSKLKKRES